MNEDSMARLGLALWLKDNWRTGNELAAAIAFSDAGTALLESPEPLRVPWA